MPKKKVAAKKTKLAKKVVRKAAKKPKTIPNANNYTMRQWHAVVETEFQPKSWQDWSREQLNKNKI